MFFGYSRLNSRYCDRSRYAVVVHWHHWLSSHCYCCYHHHSHPRQLENLHQLIDQIHRIVWLCQNYCHHGHGFDLPFPIVLVRFPVWLRAVQLLNRQLVGHYFLWKMCMMCHGCLIDLCVQYDVHNLWKITVTLVVYCNGNKDLELTSYLPSEFPG